MSQWIFLRGLTREARHWGDFPAVFHDIVAGAQIYLPDLPGNGRLHVVPSPTRIEDMVDDCRRRLIVEGAHPPYSLLGLSMGGMVAACWAQRYPDELQRCVLVNMSARPFSPFYRRLQWRSYPTLLRLALQHDDVDRVERLIWRLTSNRATPQASIVDDWVRWRREKPVSAANTLRQLLAARRFTLPAAAPTVPILVLASVGDRLVSNTCSRRLAESWQADLRMHGSAGHDLPLDDGLWIAREVDAWLRRV